MGKVLGSTLEGFLAVFVLVVLISASASADVCEPCRNVRADLALTSGSIPEFALTFSSASTALWDDDVFDTFDNDARGPKFGREKRPEPFWGHKGPKIGIEGATLLRDNEDPSPVSEPGTLGLLATGLLGMAGVARRRFVKNT